MRRSVKRVALVNEFSSHVQVEDVVEGHVMAVATEHHEEVAEDNPRMPVSCCWSSPVYFPVLGTLLNDHGCGIVGGLFLPDNAKVSCFETRISIFYDERVLH